jgi:cyclopropane-fatty-acyl-phospholipid synthase
MTFFSRGSIGKESLSHWSLRTDGGHRYADETSLRNYAAEIAVLLPPGGTLVDVGCGACELTVYLAERYEHVMGVDFSEAMLSAARARTDGFGTKNIDLMYGRAEKFPAKINGVNVILSFGVVQYLDKDTLRAHLKECSRVLSPCGVICIANVPDAKRKSIFYSGLSAGPRIRSWLQQIKMIIGPQFTKNFLWDGIGNWFTKRQLSDVASEAGFEIKFKESEFYQYRFHALLSRKPPVDT